MNSIKFLAPSFITFCILILGFTVCNGQIPVLLKEGYSLIVPDGEIHRIKQEEDSLFEYRGETVGRFPNKLEGISKIIRHVSLGKYDLLYTKSLDGNSLPRNQLGKNRYFVIALSKITGKQLKSRGIYNGLTKEQLDTTHITEQQLDSSFFYTYYSDEQLRNFFKLNPIKDSVDAQKILTSLQSPLNKKIIDFYIRSNESKNDTYGSGIRSELFTRACMDNNFSPIGAGSIISDIMRKKSPQINK